MVTGRIESGIVKVGDEVEVVGITAPQKTIVTGALSVKGPHQCSGDAYSHACVAMPSRMCPCHTAPILNLLHCRA